MRSIHLKVALVALCLATAPAYDAAIGQAPVSYVLHQIPLENPGHNTANDMNELGMAVGYHHPSGFKTGFVYDHYGWLGPEKTTHSLTEFVEVPAEWDSSCVGINDLGQIVGLFERTTSAGTERVGYLLDLDIFSATPTPSLRPLPDVPGALSSFGRKINNHGLVLIESHDIYGQYLYDSSDPKAELDPLVDPTTNTMISGIRFQDINDLGQLAGAGSGSGWRLTPGLKFLEVKGANGSRMNQDGTLAMTIPATRDKRGRIITPERAARYSDAFGLEALSALRSSAFDINDSGDVFGYNGGTQELAIYNDTDGWLQLDDIVTGDDDNLTMWLAAQSRYMKRLSNRDSTGFGKVYVTTVLATTTGKGKAPVTTYDIRHFLLVPQTP